MKDWFLGLSDREQQMAKYGAILLIISLLLAFVYLPVNRSLDDKYVRLVNLNQQLSQMQEMMSSNQGRQVRATVPENTTFSSWIDQQMVALSLQSLISRAEPVDENTMTLWLQNAPFDTIVDWLAEAESQFGVSAVQIDVVAKDKATGLSDIRMTLVK